MRSRSACVSLPGAEASASSRWGLSVLIGAGIDGCGGIGAVFDGLAPEKDVTPRALESVQAFESGAVWLRYKIK